MQQPSHELLERSDRLAAVTQQVGFTLWQLQELEQVAALFLVLRTTARAGMGEAAARPLLEKAKAQTFGVTLRRIVEAGLFEQAVQARFERILAERNWLVHRSREASRAAIYVAAETARLLERLEQLAEEALALIKVVGALVESFVFKNGVPQSQVDWEATQILQQWRGRHVT